MPLAGGLVGFAAYDVVRYFERLPTRRARRTDDARMLHYVAPRSLLVFDHLTRGIALLHAGTEPERQALRREVIARAARRPAAAPAWRRASARRTASLVARRVHRRASRRAQEYIAAGDVYQLVLSVRFAGRMRPRSVRGLSRAAAAQSLALHVLLRARRPAPSSGSSPEALVKLNGRPRAAAADRRHAAARRRRRRGRRRSSAELLADPKENAEHVMLVDLARNDLGRVATAGSVHVKPYRADRALQPRHAHRQRRAAASSRRAATPSTCSRRRSRPARWSARRRCAPWRSSTSSSRCGRGLYGGTVGYFGHGGDMDQAITIRTLVFHGDAYSFQAGAGIVADSVPGSEYDEVLAKSAVLRRALELAREGL